MHSHSLDRWQHDHAFLGEHHGRNELKARLVIALTLAMMVAEVAAGIAFGSMALLADGLHMATHAGALALAAAAYAFARRHLHNPRFVFGTGKVGDLAAFTSAITLAIIALLIGWESVERLGSPVRIDFSEAIAVTSVGLAVNLVSAWLLHGGGHDQHHHGGEHGHHHHHDHNLRAAYLHVLADALTSVLAIAGLLAGSLYGWIWMDPAMGIIGAVVIARWSWGLAKDSGAVLLDTMGDPQLPNTIRQILEVDGDHVPDLHVWRVGPGHMAAVISIVSHQPQAPEVYKAKLSHLKPLCHTTIEVHRCR